MVVVVRQVLVWAWLGLAWGCSSRKSAADNSPSNACQIYRPQCAELLNSLWLSVEDRCVHELEQPAPTSARASAACQAAAPGDSSGRLLRLNVNEIAIHFMDIAKRDGFGKTYHLNGHRYIARAANERSFIDDFRWKDEKGNVIADMYFQPLGWGMHESYADRAGDCIAASPSWLTSVDWL